MALFGKERLPEAGCQEASVAGRAIQRLNTEPPR